MNLRVRDSKKAVNQSAPSSLFAFTIIEVLAAVVLTFLLISCAMSAIYSMDLCSRRTSDITAAMAIAEAKIEDVRASTYNPPASTNFNANTNYITNACSISLDATGTSNRIPGTVVTQIYPVVEGHLVTVTVTINEPIMTNRNRPITVSLQTLVNSYCGGQQ